VATTTIRSRANAAWQRVLPAGTTTDAAVLLETRGVRAFGDGFVSVLLGPHLKQLGFSNTEIGLITTATLLGSAALTLVVGLLAYRLGRKQLLLRASVLMIATGLGFAFVRDLFPLLVVAFVGTMNPSSGDVSVFLPTEQALLPQTAPASNRTSLFARYSLVGALLAAFGALFAGFPQFVANHSSLTEDQAIDGMFLLYGALGLVAMIRYRHLSPAVEPPPQTENRPLHQSKGIVYKLAALFSLDAFAGGFVVQSMLALWLFERYNLSVATTGTIFFWFGILTACSHLAAAPLARRIGLVNTMVFTHLPANVFLMLAPLMPNLPLTIACLLVRSALSSMDIPARSSYVMAVVTPEERPAAASVTNVPRSLAAAVGPFASGFLLTATTFGWPLVIAGSLKATYDLLLLRMFQKVTPPEEEEVISASLESK
jgi:MFS family permease